MIRGISSEVLSDDPRSIEAETDQKPIKNRCPITYTNTDTLREALNYYIQFKFWCPDSVAYFVFIASLLWIPS